MEEKIYNYSLVWIQSTDTIIDDRLKNKRRKRHQREELKRD